MLKSHKIHSAYLVVNCVGLQTFWMPLVLLLTNVSGLSAKHSSYEAIYEIEGMEMNDAPRFEHRGVMIDVARNFHSTTQMLKLIDTLAMYKLNKLHFHLADDEGWRLQIPGLEELTEVISCIFTLPISITADRMIWPPTFM